MIEINYITRFYEVDTNGLNINFIQFWAKRPWWANLVGTKFDTSKRFTSHIPYQNFIEITLILDEITDGQFRERPHGRMWKRIRAIRRSLNIGRNSLYFTFNSNNARNYLSKRVILITIIAKSSTLYTFSTDRKRRRRICSWLENVHLTLPCTTTNMESSIFIMKTLWFSSFQEMEKVVYFYVTVCYPFNRMQCSTVPVRDAQKDNIVEHSLYEWFIRLLINSLFFYLSKV